METTVRACFTNLHIISPISFVGKETVRTIKMHRVSTVNRDLVNCQVLYETKIRTNYPKCVTCNLRKSPKVVSDHQCSPSICRGRQVERLSLKEPPSLMAEPIRLKVEPLGLKAEPEHSVFSNNYPGQQF